MAANLKDYVLTNHEGQEVNMLSRKLSISPLIFLTYIISRRTPNISTSFYNVLLSNNFLTLPFSLHNLHSSKRE